MTINGCAMVAATWVAKTSTTRELEALATGLDLTLFRFVIIAIYPILILILILGI